MEEKDKSKKHEINPYGKGGEYRSGPLSGTALVTGVTFDVKGLQYAEVDGKAVFEGDIILGSVAEMQIAADGELPERACIITGAQYRWPNATVPYDIDPAFQNKQRVTDAIAHWEANTNIRFIERTAANQAQYPDYVHFIMGGGCSSYVGRRGGKQDIELAGGCSTGNAIHEIGHSVGLWHEQSREDRDKFVRIQWANIDPSMQYNFNQHIADGDDVGPYDYCSIMHYGGTAFSINGKPTIVPLQPLPAGCVFGQRNGLSKGDIDAVNAMYPRLATIKEATKDPIRDITVKEIRKDPISDLTMKEVMLDPVKAYGDPIQPPIGTIYPGPYTGVSVLPFVTGAPRDAQQPVADPTAEAIAYVQVLIGAIGQQHAELLAAYSQVLQILEGLSKGGQA
jgi:hypothetical protein